MPPLEIKPLPITNETKIVQIPGSKSDTNRALVIAALAGGETALYGISESDDSRLLMQALEKLGVHFSSPLLRRVSPEATGGFESRNVEDQQTITIQGLGGKFEPFHGELTCGIAGTTGRFLAAVCSLVPGEFVLTGEGKMLERPMKELFEALSSLGVKFEYLGKEGCLPVKYKNAQIPPQPPLKGGRCQVSLRGDVSSQFFTALLLIAPSLPQSLEITVLGEQVSKSYIDMTLGIMRDFGVQVENQNYQKYLALTNQNYACEAYQIEGDASGCSYFWAIAAVTGQRIRVNNINPNSVQGDVHFADILANMGCKVIKNSDERWVEVQGPGNLENLQAVEVDMENMPDTAQTLAVVAAFANGKTKITGLSTLKAKETDRLLATKTELGKMGIQVEIGNDWMEVTGGNPKAAEIETYHDHRMAMSFAVAGTKLDGVTIQNPNVVSKSFPDFWQKLESLR